MNRLHFLSASAVSIFALSIQQAEAALAPRFAIIITADGTVTANDISRYEVRLGHNILGHPPYQLVTRDRLYAAIREQGFSNSAYADPATAAKLGKVVGASRILYVTLSIDVETSSGLLTRETYDVSSDYEVIDVSTARILSTGTGQGSNERRAAGGGGDFTTSALKTRQVAIDGCAEDVIGQVTGA